MNGPAGWRLCRRTTEADRAAERGRGPVGIFTLNSANF